MNDQKIAEIILMAKRMRKNALTIGFAAGNNGAHFGSGLSIMEIMATLYGGIMKFDPNNPRWAERDRFILSKGHGVLGYYTALAEVAIITQEELNSFEKNDGILSGHPAMNMDKGIEFSAGSLGTGLSFGVGIALAGKKDRADYKVYVLLGDGECNEGSVWEAAMAASHFKLNNLVAILDYNKMQSDGDSKNIIDMGNVKDKWSSFGWETKEVDGHNVSELYSAFSHDQSSLGRPYIVIAHTVKGKGVSFMENNKDWHHGRLTEKQYSQAISDLENLC
ncbi:MAG: transketolase [Gammaproteobacteria bacterium]